MEVDGHVLHNLLHYREMEFSKLEIIAMIIVRYQRPRANTAIKIISGFHTH